MAGQNKSSFSMLNRLAENRRVSVHFPASISDNRAVASDNGMLTENLEGVNKYGVFNYANTKKNFSLRETPILFVKQPFQKCILY